MESLSLSINCTLGTFCEPMMKKTYMYTCPSMIMICHYIVIKSMKDNSIVTSSILWKLMLKTSWIKFLSILRATLFNYINGTITHTLTLSLSTFHQGTVSSTSSDSSPDCSILLKTLLSSFVNLSQIWSGSGSPSKEKDYKLYTTAIYIYAVPKSIPAILSSKSSSFL